LPPGTANGSGRAATFNGPTSIAIDPVAGVLYVLEPGPADIRAVTRQGVVTTLGGGLSSPGALTFDPTNASLIVTNTATSGLVRVTETGAASAYAQVPVAQGIPPTLLGQITANASGTVYVTASRAGDLFTVVPAGTVSSQAVGPGAQGVVAPAADGSVYVVNQGAGALQHISASATTTIASSPLLQPTQSITFDPANATFYLTDPRDNRIIAATMGGQVTVFAGTGAATDADGTLATASFNSPSGIAYDAGTNALFVSDTNGNTIREIVGF
jgi:mucin-19